MVTISGIPSSDQRHSLRSDSVPKTRYVRPSGALKGVRLISKCSIDFGTGVCEVGRPTDNDFESFILKLLDSIFLNF